jgi:hypothetical protein
MMFHVNSAGLYSSVVIHSNTILLLGLHIGKLYFHSSRGYAEHYRFVLFNDDVSASEAIYKIEWGGSVGMCLEEHRPKNRLDETKETHEKFHVRMGGRPFQTRIGYVPNSGDGHYRHANLLGGRIVKSDKDD